MFFRSRHKRRRTMPWILVVLVIVLVVYVIVATLGAGRVFAASLDARDHLNQAEAFAKQLRFDDANVALDLAALDIKKGEQGLIPLAPLQMIPWVGDQIRGVRSVLQVSARLVPSLKDIVAIAAEVVDVVNRAKELSDVPVDTTLTYLTMPQSLRHDLLTKIHQSLPALERVKAQLTLANEDLTELDRLALAAPLQKAIEPFRLLLPELSASVDFLIPLSAMLPEFAGLDAASHFLVLFENNTELRPGGGFIGTFGTLAVEDGEIQSLTSQDVYAIDGPATGLVKTPPPLALQKYIGVDAWYFRDANWSPDFAVSSEQALALLADEQRLIGETPTSYDGVIALTPTFAADLLRLVGPVAIDGQTFTADNIAETLEYQVELGFVLQGVGTPQRKDIIGALVQEVMHRLFNLSISSWAGVLDTARSAIDQKQLLAFSLDADTQKILVDAGWGGTLAPPSGDAALVVDANLGSLKSDPSVARSLTYRVRQNAEGRLVAQLQITYTHTGKFDWKTTRYRTYTRLYVPFGSELIRGSGTLENDKLTNPTLKPGVVDVGSDLGFTTFGAFISIEPGETRTLEYDYYLPDTLSEALADGRYQLLFQKQPGAADYDLTVDVDFGKPLLSASPSEASADFGNSQYLLNTKLDQDKEFVIRF